MKIEISETLYRQMRSVVAGLQAKPTSTRYLNAVRRGRQLIRKMPTIEQIKNVNVSPIKTPEQCKISHREQSIADRLQH